MRFRALWTSSFFTVAYYFPKIGKIKKMKSEKVKIGKHQMMPADFWCG